MRKVRQVTADLLLQEYDPIVQSVAAEGGRKFHRFGADREDFAQEFRFWIYDNAERLLERQTDMDDDDAFSRYLARCLHNEANVMGFNLRAQHGGQDWASAYWYARGDLETLLPLIFDRDEWLNPPQSDGKSVSDPAMGGNWLATLADISRAYSLLDKEDQDLLRRFHQSDERNTDLASEYGVSDSTMSYRHGRALNRLHKKLGGEKPRHMRPDVQHDPFRGRHSITNAHARALTNSSYEE